MTQFQQFLQGFWFIHLNLIVWLLRISRDNWKMIKIDKSSLVVIGEPFPVNLTSLGGNASDFD